MEYINKSLLFENKTSQKVSLELVLKISEYLSLGEIELILTSNDEMKEINYTTRQKNSPTDVLSFPYVSMPNTPIGSIVINSDFINQYIMEYGHSYDQEFALLFLHGALHLLGFDHEVDNGEQREKEIEIINFFQLPPSLIVRNE